MAGLVSIPVASHGQRESGHFATDDSANIALLRTHYRMPATAQLEAFLLDHTELIQLLLEAVPHLGRCLGDVSLALRLESDDHGWETLYVDALWSGHAADAMAAIDRFEDVWWIERSSAAGGLLTFTYRLV
jgi:hypothetical protein